MVSNRSCAPFSALILLLLALVIPAASAQTDPRPQDTLWITPTTQGVFHLPATGVIFDVAYGTVNAPTRLTVTFYDEIRPDQPSEQRIPPPPVFAHYRLDAADASGLPLAYFEMPLIAVLPFSNSIETRLIGWPGPVSVLPPSGNTPDEFLVVFDAHGIYSVPAATSGEIVYLGPLEDFTPALVQPAARAGVWRTYAASPPAERTLWVLDNGAEVRRLPSAALTDRYRDRFLPEDLGNPGGWMLLGKTGYDGLIDLARTLRADIPNDPDLPAPGALPAPIDLILPFDCADDWAITWGYHHSTPQNRFAVDFAPADPDQPGPQIVYAAHAGRLFLRRYGTEDHPIDIGLAAHVVAEDGITSTVYGHLDPPGTLDLLGLEESAGPGDFGWIPVGPVAQGQAIGVMGESGYATGPHIHFALWSWDQSLYQPVPLGPLTEFERGLIVPAAAREGCDVYR